MADFWFSPFSRLPSVQMDFLFRRVFTEGKWGQKNGVRVKLGGVWTETTAAGGSLDVEIRDVQIPHDVQIPRQIEISRSATPRPSRSNSLRSNSQTN